ncbi:MAG: hypothetical protein RBR03_09155, partial [Desulfuromonas thiophila]|nr:hypothetical protein [Desulfuromonas thiophila]
MHLYAFSKIEKGLALTANPLDFLVPRDRIELPTRGFSVFWPFRFYFSFRQVAGFFWGWCIFRTLLLANEIIEFANLPPPQLGHQVGIHFGCFAGAVAGPGPLPVRSQSMVVSPRLAIIFSFFCPGLDSPRIYFPTAPG